MWRHVAEHPRHVLFLGSSSSSSGVSEGDLSDVSTDSYASVPEFTFWKSMGKDPTPQQLRRIAWKHFDVAPTCESEDTSEDEEERLEMGLTATVMEYTEKECKELLRGYLSRLRSVERRGATGGISYREWCVALRLIAEDVGGVGELEKQHAIKGVRRCDGTRAMYGAIRAPLIQEMARFARITKEDRFVDIGAGLGTVVLQMGAVVGCEAVGIELEESRYTLSALLYEELIETMEELEGRQVPGFIDGLKSRIRLIHGDLRQYEQDILRSTAIYFNNHGTWFDETAALQNDISVERRVANLFAKTAIGTRLILLKTTPHLKGNWFSLEKYVAPSKWLTWARDDKALFCYTKLKDTWTCVTCGQENDVVPSGADHTVVWDMCCMNACPSRVHRLRVRPDAGTGGRG